MNIKSTIALSFLLLLFAGCTTKENTTSIPDANYSIVVDKSSNQLTLLQGNEEIKTYSVATGKNMKTPEAIFRIVDKLENPPWMAISGKRYLPGEEGNILGSRYMMLKSTENPQYMGFGIHGTNNPDAIGKYSTQGCISMLNEDVEELFSMVPKGTEVTIRD
jgi:lipoprotein-anchoring transpeptidase ErfK/SrfK